MCSVFFYFLCLFSVYFRALLGYCVCVLVCCFWFLLHPPPRSEFHGGLRRQPHSRRRRAVVAALQGSFAKSAVWPIRSTSRCSGWIIPLFSVGNTGTRADRAGETVDAVEKEIRRMAEDGPTQKELDEAKS